METSLILYLQPKLVSRIENWGEGRENKIKGKLLKREMDLV